MTSGKPLNIFLVGLVTLLISACSYPISRAARQEAAVNLSFSQVLARPSAYGGSVVIWGGVIVKTKNSQGRSELKVEEVPLDSRGRPEDKQMSRGLFIARTPEFLDPKTYSAGRKVTLAGKVAGGELGTYNDRPYVYPVVRIKEIHLWKEPIRWDWGRVPYWQREYSPPQQYRQPLD